MDESAMDRAGMIRAVERYMRRLINFSVQGKGVEPFARGCSVMELRTKNGVYRAVATGETAETPGSRMEISVLIPERFPGPHGAEKILLHALVEGAGRMPSRDCAYGVKVESRFVSWACAAEIGDVAYITVETAPAYRGRGYAKEALRAVTARLLSDGRAPIYFAETQNAASIKTAFAAGYGEYGTLIRI